MKLLLTKIVTELSTAKPTTRRPLPVPPTVEPVPRTSTGAAKPIPQTRKAQPKIMPSAARGIISSGVTRPTVQPTLSSTQSNTSAIASVQNPPKPRNKAPPQKDRDVAMGQPESMTTLPNNQTEDVLELEHVMDKMREQHEYIVAYKKIEQEKWLELQKDYEDTRAEQATFDPAKDTIGSVKSPTDNTAYSNDSTICLQRQPSFISPKKKPCYMLVVASKKIVVSFDMQYELWVMQMNDKEESSNGWFWYTLSTWSTDNPQSKDTTSAAVIIDSETYDKYIARIKTKIDQGLEALVEIKAHTEVTSRSLHYY